MAEQKFVQAPRLIPMVRWDGTNWNDVEEFFTAKGWFVATTSTGKRLVAQGISTYGGRWPVVDASEWPTPVWLADAQDLHPDGSEIPAYEAIRVIPLDADGGPVGFDQAPA